jgi:pseudaminic acid biosynthesis-associated methylase
MQGEQMHLTKTDCSDGPCIGETSQTEVWQGEFGRSYTDRNTLGVEQVDSLWLRNYGITRSEINQSFLKDVPAEASFLEVGCNVGNQLLLLYHQGYHNLSAVEIQSYALAIARQRLKNVRFKRASALALPFEDNSFDVVFTSGVLIHIAPTDISRALDEIYRCAKRYVWGMEYYAPSPTAVNYRGHDELLWKMDYSQMFLARFADLELVREQRLPYLENENVDSVYLLRKRRQQD